MRTSICLLVVIATSICSSTALPHEIDIKGKLPDGHIIGGTETDPNEYPWQVYLSITKFGGIYSCGGTLIGNNWVLTAAHCIQGATEVTLIFGAHNKTDPTEITQQTRVVDEYFIQDDYSRLTMNNDIAVAHFVDPIKFTDAIQAIPLATSDPVDGEECVITGWGLTSDEGPASNVLMEVSVLIAGDGLCKENMSHLPGPPNMESLICLNTKNGKSPCSGDSGGPLHVQEKKVTKVAGVTSFGAHPECEIGGPEAYTSVAYYLDWIEKMTGITA